MRFVEASLTPRRFAPGGHDDEGPARQRASRPSSIPTEDLPYRVELWNPSKQAVEEILAVTVNASIGYAAYFAATKEYPDRYITLRHKGMIVSRWNGPAH